MRRRLASASALALIGTIAVGCHDTNLYTSDSPVTTDTLVAYALSGTPGSLPSALAVTYRSTVRVDGSGIFDVGFDFDAQNRIVVSPVRALVSPLLGAPLVGLQLPGGTFDSITRAPNGYYRPDTSVVVTPGQPFVLVTSRPTGSNSCVIDANPHIYAKVVIDSTRPTTTREIFMRVTVDPNCGYKSFVDGIPTS